MFIAVISAIFVIALIIGLYYLGIKVSTSVETETNNTVAPTNIHIKLMIEETDSILDNSPHQNFAKNPYVRLDLQVHTYYFYALAMQNSPKCPPKAIPAYHSFYKAALYQYATQQCRLSHQNTLHFIDERVMAYERAFNSQKGSMLYYVLLEPLCEHIVEDVYGKNTFDPLKKNLAEAVAKLWTMEGKQGDYLYDFLCEYQ